MADEFIRVCDSCGEPFETVDPYRTRCLVCPPSAGWGCPPKQHRDDDDGFGTRNEIARKQAEEHG